MSAVPDGVSRGSGIAVTSHSIVNGITNASTGVISSATPANNTRAGILISAGTIAGSVTNAGLITGGSNNPGLMVAAWGAPTANWDGAPGKITGGITNSGTMSGSVGIKVKPYSTITGDIINTMSGSIAGTISATSSRGVELLGCDGPCSVSGNTITVGTLRNAGTISSGDSTANADGIYFQRVNASGIRNEAGGVISAGGTGATGLEVAYSSITGAVANAGVIAGQYGINSFLSTFTGGISNAAAATISGSAVGIYLYSDSVAGGGITNAGLITSEKKGLLLASNVAVAAIRNDANGTIVGGTSFAVSLQSGSSVTGGVTNSGTITSDNGGWYGLYLKNGASIQSGLTNTGFIGVNSKSAIYLERTSSIMGGLTNSGTISAGNSVTSYAINVNSSAIDEIVITGDNTAKFIGKVYAPNTPVTVAAGQTYTMDNGQAFSVSDFTTTGTLGLAAGGIGTITGNYTQLTGGVLRTNVSSSTFGKLEISGVAILPSTMLFEVKTEDAAGCGGITVGNTLAGVISSVGTLGSPSTRTVSDDCTNVDFTAVKIGNAIDLVAVAPAPTTWVVTGASNNTSFGTVSCVSPVANNADATCTGTASGGYTLSGAAPATGCGTATISGNTITAGPVTAACTVTGTFAGPPVTSQANLSTTANGVTASMSVSGCSSISSAAFAAPTAGAPSNITFPFGMLGFTLNGCIRGPVAVTVTYSQPLPSNATFYKNINGSYSAYPATLGANSVTFSLTDGGSGDAEGGPPNGSIRDPGGLGVTAAAAAAPQSIPTLSEWGLIALTGMMALFGLVWMRRRQGLMD